MSDTVLIGGVFDPLHAGHLAYIRTAQAVAEDMTGNFRNVVCALSDAPHKHEPLVPIRERAELLQALGIRQVWQMSALEALQHFKPKAYIKGKDWEGRLPEDEVKACYDAGTAIVFTDTASQSSSYLLGDYERKRNAAKLEAFEDFVREQKPAEKPWEPVTPYDRETRREIEAPQADIIADAFAGCTVLDYGCGFGYLVDLLRERGMFVHGYDPAYNPVAPYLQYDLVICREVLEHLTVREVRAAVFALVHSANRFVYVTTRFTAKPHLLDVDGSDDLDPTHISMLNQDLLRTLFVLEGCTRQKDLEARLDWQQLNRVLVYEVP